MAFVTFFVCGLKLKRKLGTLYVDDCEFDEECCENCK